MQTQKVPVFWQRFIAQRNQLMHQFRVWTGSNAQNAARGISRDEWESMATDEIMNSLESMTIDQIMDTLGYDFRRGLLPPKGSAIHVYRHLGGQTELDREDLRELADRMDERGESLTPEEELRFTVRRGLDKLERDGVIAPYQRDILYAWLLREIQVQDRQATER